MKLLIVIFCSNNLSNIIFFWLYLLVIFLVISVNKMFESGCSLKISIVIIILLFNILLM